MISFNVIIMILISYLYIIISANAQSITTLKSDWKFENIYVLCKFIGEDIRYNETLLNEVKLAIEYALLRRKCYEFELCREDTISMKSAQLYNVECNIRKKLKSFFRALSIYKAGALINSIEKKLQPKDPELCNNCSDWVHQKTNCISQKPFFNVSNKESQEEARMRRNHWYWILKHRQDDVDIARLSEYLQRVYDTTNYTSLFNCTADQRPVNIETFKLQFCFALSEIRARCDFLMTHYCNEDYLEDIPLEGFSMDKYIEIFFKALEKWVDFETPAFRYCDGNSITDTTTTMGPLELEMEKTLNNIIGKDLSTNETLYQEVKNAIQHILLQKQTLQRQVSSKNEEIREKIKHKKGDYLDSYKTKLNTFSKALWIYKAAAKFNRKKGHSPLCFNCFNWNHTVDNCNSTKFDFDSQTSIAENIHDRSENYYSLLQNGEELLRRLHEEYLDGNFTNRLKPKAKNFQQFKFIFIKALMEIHNFVNYLSNSYRNEAQMREVNLYGVPLHEYALVSLRWKSENENYDKFIIEYDE